MTSGFPSDWQSASQSDSSALSRRRFLGSLAALGAAQLVPFGGGWGQGGIATSGGQELNARVIDVHHHLMPPRYLDVAREAS